MRIKNQIPIIKLTNTNKTFYKTHLKINFNENIGKMFLEAITKLSLEDAKKYVSETFIDRIDLYEIKEYLSEHANCTVTSKIYLKPKSKDIKIESILVKNNIDEANSIIDLYLVFEPNFYSKWKICGITKENSKNNMVKTKLNKIISFCYS